MAVVISDSSPLVHLSAINRFELLRELYPDLSIPQSVWDEVTIAGAGRTGAKELADAVNNGWIKLKSPGAKFIERIESEGLDRGETDALALALELKAEMILLDEVRGRTAARRLGVRAVGTLGVLIRAKARGLVRTLREELQLLRLKSQMQLSADVEELALKLAGE